MGVELGGRAVSRPAGVSDAAGAMQRRASHCGAKRRDRAGAALSAHGCPAALQVWGRGAAAPPHQRPAARTLRTRHDCRPRSSLVCPGLTLAVNQAHNPMVDTQSDSTPPGSLPLALIVGDAPRGTGWLRHLLEANGYGALTLTAGREALAVARGAIVDVIAIDTQLTDMDGVTLCRLLRTDVRVSAATPVLLVSPEPLPGADRLEGL